MGKKIVDKISVIIIMMLMIGSGLINIALGEQGPHGEAVVSLGSSVIDNSGYIFLGSILDQEQNEGNGYIGTTQYVLKLAQSFKPTLSYLDYIQLKVLIDFTSPDNEIFFYIYDDDGGHPGSQVPNGASYTYHASDFHYSDEAPHPDEYDWHTIEFPNDPSINPGDTYWIVLELTDHLTDDRHVWLCMYNTDWAPYGDDRYPDGEMSIYSNDNNWYNHHYDAMFRTYGEINNPPDTPSNPSPSDGADNIGINADLSWTGGDPDPSDTVTYDVYFGTSSSPPKVVTGQSGTTYDPGTMNYNTDYYWKIVAWDNHGASTTGSIWDFTTEDAPDNPPYTPSNPNPSDDATDIDVRYDDFIISWTGGHPDGDPVTYDVYFGPSSSNLDLVSDDQAGTSYNPGTLEFEKTYYWKINAKDDTQTTEAPVWQFTTEDHSLLEETNLFFPRATATGIEKLKLVVCVPSPWTLPENEYPNFGYRAIPSKLDKSSTSKLFNEHSGNTEPLTGVGIPETYLVETYVGHTHRFFGIPLWSYPAKIFIEGDYGITPLIGLLETSWLGRADLDVYFVIEQVGVGKTEYQICHYGIGPIEDDWYNIENHFNRVFDVNLYRGPRYTFSLRSKVTLFLTSQGLPGGLSWLPPTPPVSGWGRSEIGAKFDNIRIEWEEGGSRDDNNPPEIPGSAHGSTGTVGEAHLFTSDGSTDPEGNQIFYRWHWGDGDFSDWLGPYDSGEPVTAYHTYTKPGIFNVRLEAKDVHDDWSGLSEDSYNDMWYPEGSLVVTSPSSGDNWVQHTTQEITWDCSGYTGDFVKIALYKHNGNDNYEFYSYITQDPVQNSGSYLWTIGDVLDGSNEYRIVVSDLTNAVGYSDLFIIKSNDPPYTPTNPDPENGGYRVSRTPTLSWDGGDPDSGDNVRYRIFLGPLWEPDKYIIDIGPYPADQQRIEYELDFTLLPGTTHEWCVEAYDDYDAMPDSSDWIFTTKIIDNSCFLAGTQIAMADGSFKNIEDIVVGDMILSVDRFHCLTDGERVKEVFHHNPDEMGDHYLIINDDLRVTPNHLLLINGVWISAGDIEVGDSMLGSDGLSIQIESIESVYEQVPTYNFAVDSGMLDSHTCFAQGSLVTTKKDVVSVSVQEVILHSRPSYKQLLTV